MTTTNGGFIRSRQYRDGGDQIVWSEMTARRVRAYFGGTIVADSNAVEVVFVGRRPPVYYFPRVDVRMDLTEPSDTLEGDERLGPRHFASLRVGDRFGKDVIFFYPSPIDEGPALSEYVTFSWDAMDAWYEEDQQILRHPRDPYKRVDAIASSRHVRVLVEDTVVADTTRPVLVFETGLDVRYYLPKLDTRMDLLTPTATRTRCPYKGEAVYWTLEANGKTFEDVVWSYPAPIPEIPKIENLLAFFDERIDVEVDGAVVTRHNPGS